MDSKDKNTSNKADILDKIKKGTKFILSYKKTMFSLLGCSGSISIASFLGVPLNEIIKYTKWIIKMEELFNNIPQITSWIVFALGVASAVFSKIKEKGFKSSLKGASIYLDSV